MPPKTRFTPELILEAAMELTREVGVEMVTARSVAARLGSSTAPLFTHFTTMDVLIERLMDQMIALFVGTAASAEHEDPLVAAGVGWLRFAADEPRLYEAIFLRRHRWHAKWGPVRWQLAKRMVTQERYRGLDEAACFALVGRASVVMHGLGLEIWSGRMPRHNLQRLIEEFAVPVVQAALLNGWKSDLHSATPD